MNEKFCPSCGNSNELTSKFCKNCGSPLNNDEQNIQHPIQTNVEYEVKGNNLPFVVLKLNKGEQIICESGSMSWRTENISMETVGGGIGKVFSRMFSSEKLFQNVYTALSDNAEITFSSSFPGTILPIDIAPGKEVICQKSAFLAGTAGVDVSVHFNKKIGVGLFAGEGFIMQKISGTGKVFIEIDGSIEEKVLAPNEKLVISTGHLVMMDASCSIDVEAVHGFKNIFLGGEGLFNTIITGPGKVVLQSMPVSKTAGVISGYLPKQTNTSTINFSSNK